MSALVIGKEVDVQWNKHDRYQRIVGKVMVQPSDCPNCPKTLDAGLAQLTVGLAWWYQKYAKEQSPEDAGRYEFAEHEAKAKHVGLWAHGQPIPPLGLAEGRTLMHPKRWPATIDETVGVVIAALSDDERASIAALT